MRSGNVNTPQVNPLSWVVTSSAQPGIPLRTTQVIAEGDGTSPFQVYLPGTQSSGDPFAPNGWIVTVIVPPASTSAITRVYLDDSGANYVDLSPGDALLLEVAALSPPGSTPFYRVLNTPVSTLVAQSAGTWVPVDGSGAGLALVVTDATWYRVGRLLTVAANLAYPATADVANAVIAGLPFAPDIYNMFGVTLNYSQSPNLQAALLQGPPPILVLYRNTVNVTNVQMSGFSFRFTAQYTVA